MASAVDAQSNQETPKFSLAIRAGQSEVALGSDIDLYLTLTNTSQESLLISYSYGRGFPSGFHCDLRDGQGELVPRIGKRYKQFPNGDRMEIPPPPYSVIPGGGKIQPGESIKEFVKISNIYQFDHPGKYTIQVSRKESWSPTVYSNIITVTVAGGAPLTKP